MHTTTKFVAIAYIVGTLSINSNLAFADTCTESVQHLTEKDKVPCEGYLFSPAKEKEIRLEDQSYKILKEESDTKDQQINLYKQSLKDTEQVIKTEQDKAELWRAKAEDSSKKYIEAEDDRGIRDFLFMLGGVVMTIASGWALGQTAIHSR